MPDTQAERISAVDGLIAVARGEVAQGSLDRDGLGRIGAKVEELAARADLWGEADFPAPPPGEQQNRYRIGGVGPEGITLYLNVMRPGKVIPPHNHTTWACIAAVEGVEHNTLYDRVDDRSAEGRADLRARETVALGPGRSLVMMPDDIHSVEIRGDQVIRHLHFYGRPLESLTGRIVYDPEAGTCWNMDIGVKTIGAKTGA